MIPLPQVVNRYLLIALPLAALAAWAVALLWRRPRSRWWAAWMVACIAVVGTGLALRTPAVTLIEPTSVDDPEQVRTDLSGASTEQVLAAIREPGGKAILVEFYADLGLG